MCAQDLLLLSLFAASLRGPDVRDAEDERLLQHAIFEAAIQQFREGEGSADVRWMGAERSLLGVYAGRMSPGVRLRV